MKIMKEDRFMEEKNIKLEQLIKEFSRNDIVEKKKTRIERKYIKYSRKFQERFGRDAYIAEPGGTRKQTIEAIKICLKKNKDILDEILHQNSDKFIY